jgi:excisionase family DNA binding protein
MAASPVEQHHLSGAQIEAALLTLREVGTMLGVGRSTVYRLIDAGRLSTVKITAKSVRVPRTSVCELIDELIAEGAPTQDEGLAGQTSPSDNSAGLGRNACQA